MMSPKALPRFLKILSDKKMQDRIFIMISCTYIYIYIYATQAKRRSGQTKIRRTQSRYVNREGETYIHIYVYICDAGKTTGCADQHPKDPEPLCRERKRDVHTYIYIYDRANFEIPVWLVSKCCFPFLFFYESQRLQLVYVKYMI